MMLLYEKHTNKPKPSHSGLLMLAFDQGAMTNLFAEVGPPWFPPMCWCLLWQVCPHGVMLCLSDHGCRNFVKPLLADSHPDAQRSLSHSSSSLLQRPGSAWQVQAWFCAEAEPLSSWEGHPSHLTTLFEE